MNTFVCSDIHGHYDAWQEALNKSGIDLENGDKLIILGDLIDRGNQSYEAVSFAIDLQMAYPEQVVYLMGNHEKMMLDFLNIREPKSPEGYYELIQLGELWLMNGGSATVNSFVKGSPSSEPTNVLEVYEFFHTFYPCMIQKLNALPYYHIDGGVVYVHAGFESGKPLLLQDADTMVWIRDEFYNGFSPVSGDELDGKLIVHGHTPVQYFDDYTGRGFYKGSHHLCVDGGSARGENVLVINMDDMSYIEQKIQSK